MHCIVQLGRSLRANHCGPGSVEFQRVSKELVLTLPGEPPKWTPPKSIQQLREDSGDYFRDKNAARYPNYPLEAMIKAIVSEHQDFDLGDIDIVACSSTLGNLLRFARGQEKSCRMLIEVVDSTVFFLRRENSPRELLQGVRGFGHTFPEAYTTWSQDVRKSYSAHRVMKYDLAEFKCLVRFDVDGYLPSENKPKYDHSSTNTVKRRSAKGSDVEDDLLSALGCTKVSIPVNTDSDLSTTYLQLRSAGTKIPQAAIFDLKTRTIKRSTEDFFAEEAARFWVTQIPNFILAFHQWGTFKDIRIQDVRARVKEWEEEQQPALKKFVVLLKTIVSFVKSSEDGRIELRIEEGEHTVELRKQCDDVGSVLSSELKHELTKNVDINTDGAKLDSSPAAKQTVKEKDDDESRDFYSEPDFDDDYLNYGSDDESEKDFTACSLTECGYCGHCDY